MSICKCCSKEFVPSGLSINNAHKQLCCSVSCSNKFQPRRKKKISNCVYCGQPVSFFRSKHCDKCKQEGRHRFYRKQSSKLLNEITIGEYIKTARNGSNKYDCIRGRARSAYMRSDKPKHCRACGFDKHFEVCHIKPISEFSLDSLVSDVNHDDNLVALCPNCHWLFDHDLLKFPPVGLEPTT